MSPTDEVPSVEQDGWVAIAECIRGHIRAACSVMPTMDPAALNTFLEAVQKAYLIELDAHTFDKRIEKQLSGGLFSSE